MQILTHIGLKMLPSLVLALVVAAAPSAWAQNLFGPVAYVDDTAVTGYEVQQRQRFMQLLNAPGSDTKRVLEELINDRLKMNEMKRRGLNLTEEDITNGMEDFAKRANLSADEFIKALGQAGVERETFRDFIIVSNAWRELIRGLYNNRVNISDAEIEKEMGMVGSATGIRLLLSEIIIPAPPQKAASVAALADQIAQSKSEAEFSGYATRYSATASRGRGGRMPWTPLEKLPPALHPILMGLSVGEVTPPLPIPNAIALFQLRGIEETGQPSVEYSEIEYAAYYMPGGRSDATLAKAAQLRGQVDGCNDLYAVAKGQPKEMLDRETKKPGELPKDFAIELSKLDPGEVSTALTRSNGQNLVFLMLCKRVAAENADVTREQAVAAIRQRKLEGYSRQLLEQLRANARITQ